YYKSYFDSKGNMPATDPDYDKTLIYLPADRDTPLTYSEGRGRDQNWYIEGRADYNRSFGEHKVSGLLLYNQSRDYYPEAYIYIPRSYIGVVGRATYSYQKKYLLDINIGYNGSENFAPGKNRFGFFPAFSAGWVATEEKFMAGQDVFDYLKFRVSWGRVGNDKGISSRFMYMPAVWQGAGGYSFGVNTPENIPAFGISRIGNPNVSWETADKQNYGMDLKSLDGRLSFNFDYFRERRRGILISPESTPAIIATALPNINIGKVDNHGYEVTVGWKDKIGREFDYYLNANVSFARNKIIYQDEVPKQFDYMNVTGGPTGRQTGVYKYLRLYQYDDFTQGAGGEMALKPELPQPYQTVYPGDAMYADLNGDNIVDGNDKCVTGYATRPEYTSGLNMGCNWKGLSFSMQWVGAAHVSRMYDIEYRIPFTNAGKRGLLTYFYEGCWTPENQQDAVYPRPAEESESWNSEPSTLWLQDASYIRLKSLNIGYTITDHRYLKKMGIHSLGISLSGYNLLTFSSLKYLDPESNPDRFGDYPLIKLYSFGLNFSF
ncbi:MAG: SusC/RagA family TonB-linked outer membrane protein, partial [Proteiniphilum sp.]|nr:SusC/RagA family TonB-linked outer membrane protein [Proteiniphilum sp.]